MNKGYSRALETTSSTNIGEITRPSAAQARGKSPGRTKGKGRSKRLGPDERRQAIMAAAKELFLTKGFFGTCLEDVVAESGGSLSTVYQLFGNKQGLWEALVAQATQDVTAPLQAEAAHQGDPRKVLKEFAIRLFILERSRENAGAVRLMLAEAGNNPDLARTLFEKGPDASRKIVTEYLDAEVAAGRLDIPDTNLATELFGGMICADYRVRNCCGLMAPMSEKEMHRRLDTAVDMFLIYYSPKKKK